MSVFRFFVLVAGIWIAGSACAERVFRRSMERVSSIDPIKAATLYDSRVCGLIYETLLEVDYFKRPYELKAGCAELPTISDDGLVYTFKLRESRFAGSDNRRMTAHDVVYSLSRLRDVANASSGMWVMADVNKIEAIGDDAVRFTLRARCHYFPWLMTLPCTAIIPADGGFVGSGPYRLDKWERNHRMSFARNPVWWRLHAAEMKNADKSFDRIDYLVIDDASTQWLMFLAGEIDFLGEVSRDNWSAVINPDGTLGSDLERKGVRLHRISSLDVGYIGFNLRDPVVGKDKKLRQALNCAFNQEAWLRFLNSRVDAANGPIPPGINGRIEEPSPYAYNLEKAKRLLAEAGYPDGIDPATSRRLTLTVAVGRASQDVRESLELLASFYERIGVVLVAKYMTWTAFIRSVREHNEQLYWIGWVGDYPDAQNFLQLFHSGNIKDGGLNYSGYSNKEFDANYERALCESDEEKRNGYWRKCQEIVREDCPWIFVHFDRAFSLTQSGVEGYLPTVFPAGTEKHLWKK